jgi:deoxyribodipyrimidine photolyase-related protein
MNQSDTTLRLILGDQLNENHSWYSSVQENVIYVMMEVRSETDYVKHHIQKVAAFFASMRAFATKLKEKGHRVHYLYLDDSRNQQDFTKNLLSLVALLQATTIEYQEPDEYRLNIEFRDLQDVLGISVRQFSTEHFLVGSDEFSTYFSKEKMPIMEFFYRKMRKRYQIMMDENGDDPIGGKWNFDHLNRNKLPQSVSIPERLTIANDVRDIVAMIHANGVSTIGSMSSDSIAWPINRSQALDLLNDFLKNGLFFFGTYQDALTDRDPFLFHSRLSFALNSKMLHPLEVCNVCLEYWRDHPEIDIAQVEGFIRQIIGWREYVRGVYWISMPEYASKNYLDHKEKLPQMYWSGQTQMACMRQAIGQSLEFAYAHHIQRLMVTGNFALLLGVHPDEVDAWYLGVYIDAIEWVEMPNTRGMSQFADGGVVGTKPYVSSANYLNKMGDHCKSCHYNYKEKIGSKACPFNALYWDFYIRHEDKFRSNPRVSMAYRHIDKFSNQEKEAIIHQADFWRLHADQL